MNTERHILLWILVVLFIGVSGIYLWSFLFERQAYFAAGTQPQTNSATPNTPRQPPLRPTDPIRGSLDSNAVVIAEWADFTCLYCRATEPELLKAVGALAIPVRLVWRDLPISTERPDALTAALAGRCAQEQNKFWEMHDVLLETQDFDTASLTRRAESIGIEPTSFERCLSTGRYIKQIQTDVSIARQHGIDGAPTFFIGNQVVSGYMNAEQFQILIQQAAQ